MSSESESPRLTSGWTFVLSSQLSALAIEPAAHGALSALAAWFGLASNFQAFGSSFVGLFLAIVTIAVWNWKPTSASRRVSGMAAASAATIRNDT